MLCGAFTACVNTHNYCKMFAALTRRAYDKRADLVSKIPLFMRECLEILLWLTYCLLQLSDDYRCQIVTSLETCQATETSSG